MITTTVLIAVQFKYVKGFPAWTGVLFFLFFGFFDGTADASYESIQTYSQAIV